MSSKNCSQRRKYLNEGTYSKKKRSEKSRNPVPKENARNWLPRKRSWKTRVKRLRSAKGGTRKRGTSRNFGRYRCSRKPINGRSGWGAQSQRGYPCEILREGVREKKIQKERKSEEKLVRSFCSGAREKVTCCRRKKCKTASWNKGRKKSEDRSLPKSEQRRTGH